MSTSSARPRNGSDSRDPRVAVDEPVSWRTNWPIGDVLARVVVPLWVSAGALMKLAERNPNLLPPPIVDLVRWAAAGYMEERNHVWLIDSTLRTLIGIELALVVGMVLAPRISRLLAGFTLTVFLVILAEMMRRDWAREGFMAMLTGSCGCLGAKSPPPPIMFAIDLVLLVGIVLFPITSRLGTRSTALVPLGLVFGSIGAFTLAFMTPPKAMRIVLPPEPDEPPVVADDGSAARRPSTGDWPARPETAPMYFPQTGNWIGRRMSEVDLLLQMSPPPRPELLRGIAYIVVYRGDCGNCHDLLEVLMSGERADRTIVLRVAEGDPANDKPMASDRFHMHALPDGPTYVLTTPLLAVVRDGVIRSASAGVDLESALAMMESVELEAPAPSDPPAPRIEPAPEPAPATAPPAPHSARAWPARPDVEPMYFPQFEQWIGRRLDAQALALQIGRPMPVNEGLWHVLFYRADCDRCHEMMEIYLVGDFEHRVIAVAIPDTDPAGDLGMPLTNALLRSLPQGPTYVMSTPVLLTVKDGVVLCMATDPMDDASVIGCLTAE